MNPVEQIIDIYRSDAFWWVSEKASPETLRSYLWQVIDRGNLFWSVSDDKVAGLCETWRISADRLGKIVCGVEDPIEKINTTDGNIAFAVNVWVGKEYRMSETFKLIRTKWFQMYRDCEYYCEHAKRRKHGLFKVYKRR